MSNIIDARGLSCPQPVIMTLNEINKATENELVIAVDTDTARENVSRAAGARGWEVAAIEQEDGGYRITIRKGD